MDASNRNTDAYALVMKAIAILSDKKGEDITAIDVSEVSSLSDYVILVSGASPPHLKAMFNDVQRILKQDGILAFRRNGTPESGWMVLDYVDVVIHIFLNETRQYYALADLWPEAPRLEW